MKAHSQAQSQGKGQRQRQRRSPRLRQGKGLHPMQGLAQRLRQGKGQRLEQGRRQQFRSLTPVLTVITARMRMGLSQGTPVQGSGQGQGQGLGTGRTRVGWMHSNFRRPQLIWAWPAQSRAHPRRGAVPQVCVTRWSAVHLSPTSVSLLSRRSSPWRKKPSAAGLGQVVPLHPPPPPPVLTPSMWQKRGGGD